ncbi:MAG: hypothetical protein R3B55_03770 [Candidatus Paceibacterota bacterium]
MKNLFRGQSIIFSIIIIIAVVFAGFYILNNNIYEEKQSDDIASEPYRATLTGVQTCLPHKDTSGPQTLECAIGMKIDSGEYYALDFMAMSQIPPEIQDGDRFTASGVITPIENLSSDQWQKYDMEGIFSVTNSVIVENKKDIVGFSWEFQEAGSLNPDGNPQTEIYLKILRDGGETERKMIETVDGSCNSLPDADEDVAENSTQIQCYYAGAGERFKIVKDGEVYQVKLQTFEEGLPDYNPPAQQYEVFMEFSS